MAEIAPVLRMRGVAKRFGATVALDDVAIELDRGEVLALIGENGAGKSTLMKVLSGVHRPDAGTIELEGEAFVPRDPADARASGIVMIYQELTLAPDLAVEENLVLGVEPRRFGLVDRGRMRAQAREALAELGCEDVDPAASVRELGIAQRQMVEIARAMIVRPRVLVLDEPTSSLTGEDTRHLFATIARLRAQGVAVIYISHFLEECREVADRFAVLRDGRTVAAGEMAGVDEDALIRHMVGRDVDELYPRIPHEIGDEVLRVDGLVGRKLPLAATFSLRRGEVLGIFGLVGAGRTEMLRCVFGLEPVVAGSVHLAGDPVPADDPHGAWAAGLGMVSEDRKDEGLMLARDLADNLTLPDLHRYARWGLVDGGAQHRATDRWMADLDVRATGPDQRTGDLSGGNQQKIALGRCLHHDCAVLLLDEPTRGVDVGAKARIYRLIGEQAAAGKGIVVVSSYVPELLHTCDRIAVMCRGRLGPARPAAEWDEHRVLAAAIGAEGGGDG